MSWRSVFIANKANINLKNNQLCINQNGEDYLLPFEDIGAIMIEASHTNLTSSVLARLGQEKIPVFFCDDKHLPCSVVQPFNQHSRQQKVLNAQLEASLPFKKKIWQQIIQQKISNQAKCLELTGNENHKQLSNLAEQVLSGDSTGKEAHAAKIYFSIIFQGKTREDDTVQNAALNYGYSILRGVIARSITAYGLQPALGVHHHSELNPFNLADDIIEPFRPIVDLWVCQNIEKTEDFSQHHRQQLIGLLHYDIKIQNKKQTLIRAIDICCAQLAAAYINKNTQKLVLPELIPLQTHEYE